MASRTQPERWLFGPVSDLTLGCGLGYIAIFALLIFAGTDKAALGYLGLVPLVSLFTGTPHYGATLLRVYEQRSERRAYAIFAVWMTAVVWAWFYLGLYSAFLGSLLLTLYLSWSPWHYSGQNYGIALLFLRRRGIEVTPLAKRAIYLSFILSFVLTLLAIHGAAVSGNAEYAAVQPYRGGSFRLLRLGLPSPWWEIGFAVVGAVYLGAIGTAAVLLLRRARAVDLLPTAALVFTQAMWFSLPPLARHWDLFGDGGAFARQSAAYAFFWVATGHTVQYVWITVYYAAGGQGYGARARFFTKALLAGSFIWSVPALLYTLTVEGGRLGGVAIGPDVGVLIAAAVNIHHFILDGAIWKLRDGRVARILIRREADARATDDTPLGPGAPRRRWLSPVVYAAGALATLAVLGAIWQREWVLRPALEAGDFARVHRALERLDWIGHDGPDDYRRAGRMAMARRQYADAERYFRLSLEKHRSAMTWILLGQLASTRNDPAGAIAAFERALEIDPNQPDALNQLGLTLLRQGEPERALVYLERVAALVPDDETLQASLRRARQRVAQSEETAPAARGGAAPERESL